MPPAPIKRGRGRPRKYPLPAAAQPAAAQPEESRVLNALLNDPSLLDVDQYEYREPDAAAAPAQPALSSAAEPDARAELNSLVTAAAYQEGFSVVPGAQPAAPVAPDDSTRARQVTHASAVGAVARWKAEELVVQPSGESLSINVGAADQSIHVVDLRARIVAESSEAVAEVLAKPIAWRRVERATPAPAASVVSDTPVKTDVETRRASSLPPPPNPAVEPARPAPVAPADDFFLDTVTPQAAVRNRRNLARRFEFVGRAAWLYWSLVGQVAAAGPSYIGEALSVLRSRRAAPPSPRRSAVPANTLWHRTVRPSLALAVVAVLVISVPLLAVRWVQNVVADSQQLATTGEAGLQQLQSGLAAAADMDFATAQADLQAARESFASVGAELAGKPSWLFQVAKALPGSAGAAGHSRDLAAAGEEMAAGGEALSSSLTSLQLQGSEPITDQLKSLRGQLEVAHGHLSRAADLLRGVPPEAVPEPYRERFGAVQQLLPTAVQTLETFGQAADFAYGFLGGDGPKTYLIVSQNPNELRGTGGFLGGLAVVTVDRGAIQRLDMPGGGPYDLEAAQKVRVAGPKPLRLLRDGGWYIWDANWWPDGPTSLDKVEWFWKNSDGRPVDGVLAVGAHAFADLLAVTGPVDMPEYGKTITAENFIVETQESVELEYDREENKPKQFLADLAPRVLERLFKQRGPQLVSTLGSVRDSLASGSILLRLRDGDLQARAHAWGWDGALRPAEGDYAMLVDTNIGGGKTDGSIAVDVAHRAEVQADGSIIDTVRVTRTHRGTPGDHFTGVTNVDYMRLYVPEGAELLSASGFNPEVEQQLKDPLPGSLRDPDVAAAEDKALRDEVSGTRITRELGKTAFGNWVVLPVGETRTVELRYRLPQRLWVPAARADWLGKLLGATPSPYAVYQLVLQAQPGTTDRRITHELALPAQASVAWSQGSSGLHVQAEAGSLRAVTTLVGTQTYGAILHRPVVR